MADEPVAQVLQLTIEAESVLAYFRQAYWPHEERSINALQLHRSVSGSRDGIQALITAGMVTPSLDNAFFRLTDAGAQALGLPN